MLEEIADILPVIRQVIRQEKVWIHKKTRLAVMNQDLGYEEISTIEVKTMI